MWVHKSVCMIVSLYSQIGMMITATCVKTSYVSGHCQEVLSRSTKEPRSSSQPVVQTRTLNQYHTVCIPTRSLNRYHTVCILSGTLNRYHTVCILTKTLNQYHTIHEQYVTYYLISSGAKIVNLYNLHDACKIE